LEGATGIGKSAIIIEAAIREKKPLTRFNLSSKIDESSLFGTSYVRTVDDKIEVGYKAGPFTEAYIKGYWLLLDEMNLAPANVIATLETALESGPFTIFPSHPTPLFSTWMFYL
jgi:midasin